MDIMLVLGRYSWE